MILGVIYMLKGDELIWDDIDKWLNASIFGQQNAIISLPFSSEEEEYMVFLELFYQPKFNIEWEETYYSLPTKGSKSDPYTLNLRVTFPLILNDSFKWGALFSSSIKSTPKRMYTKISKRATLKSERLYMRGSRYQPSHLPPKAVECESYISYPKANVLVLKIPHTPRSENSLNISFEWEMPTIKGDYVLKNSYQLTKDSDEELLLTHFKSNKEKDE